VNHGYEKRKQKCTTKADKNLEETIFSEEHQKKKKRQVKHPSGSSLKIKF
jgi:hypothetical protein